MKIGVVQFDIAWEEREKNFKRVSKLVQHCKDCDVIVLPEVFSTGFSVNKALAETRGGKTERFLSQLASSLRTNVLAGYLLNIKGKVRNVATLFSSSGKRVATYSKIHLFSLLGEDKVFERGRKTVVFEINRIPCSVFICYDLRFPEVFRKVADRVYVIFVIANWPKSRAQHWLTLLRARAIENQCFTVGVNRVGEDENRIIYFGNSVSYDPFGETLFDAGNEEGFFTFEIPLERVREIRESYPFLRDRVYRN